MKRILDGKTYNTGTATHICEVSNIRPRSDFQSEQRARSFYQNSDLYVTKNGAYFLAGSGGPSTRFAREVDGWLSGGSGIIPLTKSEACDVVERECRTDEDADLIQEFFGDILEDA